MTEIGVVHLVRNGNGIAPVERFLASYREHPAGIEHDLVIVFKGFRRQRLPAAYEAFLANQSHRRLFVPDAGYDISAYISAARALPHRYLCFLNSFSVILASGWLATLHSQASQDGIGIAGATGSYQSKYSALFFSQYLHPNHPPYKKFLLKWFPFLRATRNLLLRPVYRRFFEPFPNYHIRTNGFMLRRDMMLAIQSPRIRTKFSSYLFESGHSGLTKQILAMGGSPVVVGSDGKGYRAEDWHLSNTFWQSDQENLLIGDNQTEQYRAGSLETRRYYSAHAWGKFARPVASRKPVRNQ